MAYSSHDSYFIIELEILCSNGVVLKINSNASSSIADVKRQIGSDSQVTERSTDYDLVHLSTSTLKLVTLKESDILKNVDFFVPVLQMVPKEESKEMTMLRKDKVQPYDRLVLFIKDVQKRSDEASAKLRSRFYPDQFICAPNVQGLVQVRLDIFGECRDLEVDVNWTPTEFTTHIEAQWPIQDDNQSGARYLRIKNRNEIMFENIRLIKYKYIYKCYMMNKVAHLTMLILKNTVVQSLKLEGNHHDAQAGYVPSCNIDENFRLTLRGLRHKAKIALYHGVQMKECRRLTSKSNTVQFFTNVNDVPRCALICIVLIGSWCKKKDNIIAWVNIPIFDIDGIMKSWSRLPLNPFNDDCEKFLDKHGFCINGQVTVSKPKSEHLRKRVDVIIQSEKCKIQYCPKTLDGSHLLNLPINDDESSKNFSKVKSAFTKRFDDVDKIIDLDPSLRDYLWKYRLIAPKDCPKFRLVQNLLNHMLKESFRDTIGKQMIVMKRISKICDHVAAASNKAEATLLLRSQLKKYKSELENWHSPLHPTIGLGPVQFEECLVFDSNRRPLKIIWKNIIESNVNDLDNQIAIIFKSGDDLCHESAALQILKLFESFWNGKGHHFPLVAYDVHPVLKLFGMIEMVPESKSILDARREVRVPSALNPFTFISEGEPLYYWMKKFGSKRNLEYSVEVFTRSCVGYSVAADILGFGDRHPSNILICTNGQMVHIDFSYMYGNYIKAGPINREWSPIVLVSDFVEVMSHFEDNDSLERFFEMCNSAYSAIRDRIHDIYAVVISLPRSEECLQFLWNATLLPNKSNKEALEACKQRIKKSKDRNLLRKIDWEFHAVAHPRQSKK
ncbi:hypothetical protein ACOME3_007702 [Neoechinorhynchus agilis]